MGDNHVDDLLGSLVAEEGLAVEASGEAPLKNPFLILARLWHQTRLTSSSTATVVNNETQWLNRAPSEGQQEYLVARI